MTCWRRSARFIAAGTPRQVTTVNPEFVMEARRNPGFAAVLAQADICMPDGVGLLWAARRLGRSLPQRVTGSDSVPLISQRAAEQGWRLYLLGAAPGVAERTAEILAERYPGLRVVGTHAGSPADAVAPEIIARIRRCPARYPLRGLRCAQAGPLDRAAPGCAGRAGDDGRGRLVRFHRRRPEARPALGAAAEPGMVVSVGHSALALAAAARSAAVRMGCVARERE